MSLPAEQPLTRRQEFVIALSLFLLLRVMMLFWFTPRYSEFREFHYPFAKLSDAGALPFVHYWLEYPPVFPYVSLAAYRASGMVADGAARASVYCSLLQVVMVLFESGNFVLLYLLAIKLRSEGEALKLCWIYACLYFPVFAVSGYFESIPLFFMLLSLVLLIGGRVSGSAVCIGVGAMTKVIPILILPVLIKWARSWQERVRGTVVSLLAVVAIAFPFLVVSPEMVATFVRANMRRGPWETVWAICARQYYFGYLGPPLHGTAPGDAMQRFVSHEPFREAIAAVSPSRELKSLILRNRIASRFTTDLSFVPESRLGIGYGLIGLVFLALVVHAWRAAPASPDPEKMLLLCGFILMLFLVYSKGWSPQFLIYVLPFPLLLLPIRRAVAYAVALSVVTFVEMPIWLYYLMNRPVGPAALTAIVVARTCLLLALSCEFYHRLGRRTTEE